jgi:hypothetical protein
MLLGAFLTALGILALVFPGGIRYTSHKRFPPGKSAQIITNEEKIISIPPLVGVLTVAGGVAVMILAARK